MTMNVNLFRRILEERELYQYQVARQLGWHPGKLSSIIHDHYAVNSKDAKKLAQALGVAVGDLFPELGIREIEKELF